MRMLKFITVLATAGLVATCGDDPVAPTMTEVAGSYSATTYEITDDTGTMDRLAGGISIDITLEADGTTSGNMFKPDQFTEPDAPALNLSLDGTWTLNGSTVRFDHDSDTFLRDVPFTVSGDRLIFDMTENGVSGLLILTKNS